MKENLYSFFNSIVKVLDVGWIFLCVTFFTLSLVVLNLILSAKVVDYSVKKRKTVYLSQVFLLSVEVFFESITNSPFLFLMNLSIIIIGQLPFLIKESKSVKEITVTSEQKKVISEAEQKLSQSNRNDSEISPEIQRKSVLFSFDKLLRNSENYDEPEIIKTTEKTVKKINETKGSLSEYSGVKKAIEKTLGAPSLSSEDRRKVLELEFFILQRERGEDNKMVKENINEGLSALLKIMSKNCV